MFVRPVTEAEAEAVAGESTPCFDATVAETGIDPDVVNVEMMGLMANARSALRRVYNREVL